MTAGCHSDIRLSIVNGSREEVDRRPPPGNMGQAAGRGADLRHALPRGEPVKVRRLKPLTDTQEIRFVREVNWTCGVFYTHWGKFEVVANDRRITVVKLGAWRRPDEWAEVFTPVRLTRPLLNGDRTMASKWIKAAITKKAKGKPGALPMDAGVGKDRPAITDFMTELEGPDGGIREPSMIMFGMSADGVRAGLKDEDGGGWCWREGRTLQEALDAIEKALQAGEGAFRAPRPQKKKK